MDKYVDLFVEYLQKKCGYPESAIIKTIYRYDEKDYGRVEILEDELIIQAFVLLSEDHCRQLDKFPFYRTYSQRNTYGYLVSPACNVAVYDEKNGKWHFYSPSNLRAELTSASLLNYDNAKERFEKRFNYLGNEKIWKTIKMLSMVLLCIIVLYVVAHVLSVNGCLGAFTLPLDATVVSIFVILMCLLLIPQLIPYIRSLNIGNVGIEMKEQNSQKGKK